MIQGRRYEFGVSGALYKRNLLFYDRQTNSLWSQLQSEAVTGPMAGSGLSVIPAENTPWEAWKREHPRTLVLSFATGYQRDYREDPYAAYPLSRRFGLLVSAGGAIKIYPFSELKNTDSPLVDQVGGKTVTISFNRRTETARVEKPVTEGAWFVSFLDDLKAFYRQAEVYHAARK